jgi:hypothetical protein
MQPSGCRADCDGTDRYLAARQQRTGGVLYVMVVVVYCRSVWLCLSVYGCFGGLVTANCSILCLPTCPSNCCPKVYSRGKGHMFCFLLLP